MRVRKAKAPDLDQFAKNVQSVADEGRYLFTEEVTTERKKSMGRLFKRKDCLVLVAEVRKGKDIDLVGSLTLSRYGDVKKSSHVRVLGMLVIKGHRGMGIGTELIARSLEWARAQKGIEKIQLAVFSGNQKAYRLYEKFGFQVEGVKKRQYYIDGEPQDEVEMALFLR